MSAHIETLVVGPLAVNCYLVGDPQSREAIVIDPGDEGGRIVERLRGGQWRLTAVVLTHAHFDHLLAVRDVLNALPVPFLMPAGEEEMLARVPLTVQEWLGLSVEPPPEPSGTLVEGDTVTVGAYSWRVVSTPGHSPAGICLIGEEEAFVGDTLFAGSIGRTDLTGGDYDTLMEGIRRHLLPLDDQAAIYPGHGPATTMGQERRYNPFIRELLDA